MQTSVNDIHVRNLALHKPVRQSSTLMNCVGLHVVDGETQALMENCDGISKTEVCLQPSSPSTHKLCEDNVHTLGGSCLPVCRRSCLVKSAFACPLNGLAAAPCDKQMQEEPWVEIDLGENHEVVAIEIWEPMKLCETYRLSQSPGRYDTVLS